jgi:hypothetical protein
MAPGDSVLPERIIYRAVSPSRIDKATERPKETAFLLRPASDTFPAETSLTFGMTAEAATRDLTRVKTCQIRVSDVLALDYGLKVCEGEDPDNVQVSGMPLYGVDDGLALAIAKAIRDKSSICG